MCKTIIFDTVIALMNKTYRGVFDYSETPEKSEYMRVTTVQHTRLKEDVLYA